MLGYNVQVEQATSQGRMDVTLQTKDYVYILELKLDKSAEEALQQIKDNQYARPFQADPRKVFLVGVNFSSATRTVEKWIVEEGIMTEWESATFWRSIFCRQRKFLIWKLKRTERKKACWEIYY